MDLKKLGGQTLQFFSRAVQYTEEKLGNAEKTELDGHFESLSIQSDNAKLWSEKLVTGVESVLVPNPGNRVEDMLMEKIDKPRPNRLSNLEYLGLDMVQAGNEFGPGTAYGSALLKVGGAEQRLGLIERNFIGNADQGYLQPMKKFLDTEMKTIVQEKRLLNKKRLDLDACKSRVRKAKSMDGQTAAEAELRKAQADFDRQVEITKLLLEGVRSSQASHLRHLNEFVEAQIRYYEESHKVMVDLQKEMASLNPDGVVAGVAAAPANTAVEENGTDDGSWRKAKVVCDYDATNKDEMSLMMDEEVFYQSKDGEMPDFVLAKRGIQSGQVPSAYLEPVDD